jgi:hypothetical protein
MSTHDDDLAARTRTVLDAAAEHVFGTEPGRLAAELYDVLVRTTDHADRARVAAALARVWVYGGHADRAVRFADESLDRAERTGDPELVVDCLDAMLAAHWGPDELGVRARLGARLDEVAAHVLDPESRLRAHLWSLQVALETLNVQGIHRQLRALEVLGQESPRARFFAESRQWMHDVLRGRTDRAAAQIAAADAAAQEAGLADAWMVLGIMRAYTALHTGDLDTAASVTEQAEQFARTEGVTEVAAEAAALWSFIGRPDRAARVVAELGGDVLTGLPRDVNLLLTLQCVLEAALVSEDEEVVATASSLLAPYEGRAVINAGAVQFHGVTDDTLSRAAAVLGDTERSHRLRERALATYQRIGAPWWHDRLRGWQPPARPAAPHEPPGGVRFQRTVDGVWLVGAGAGHPMRPLRGLDYLHRLVSSRGTPIPALELVSDGTGTVLQPDAGPAIDRQAAAAYRSRLADIDAELAEAEEWADQGRADKLAGERQALLDELSSAAGLGGRTRSTGSSRERARVAATKAIGTAIDRIAAVDAGLGQHLRSAVRTGTDCSYEPRAGDDVHWLLGADG